MAPDVSPEHALDTVLLQDSEQAYAATAALLHRLDSVRFKLLVAPSTMSNIAEIGSAIITF